VLTSSQRSLLGRIGAAVARSRHDPRDLTSQGRKVFLQRFELQIRTEYPHIADAEVQRRAGELRRAYMSRLALASSMARAKRKAAGPETTTASKARPIAKTKGGSGQPR